MNELEKELADCPEELEWGVIAGQRRAMENEEVLKRDVRTVGIASLVIFTLLTVLCYRCDLRSLLIPLIPLTASFLVLGAMPLLFRDCLFFVAGMGGVVVGLAVDYGIHIYSAMTETHPLRRLFRICAPLFTGALTSFAVFAVFLFSSTDGLRQLGFFAGCSLLLSMILMLLFLPPLLLGPGGREKKRKEKNLQYHGLRRIPPPDFPFRRPKTVLCIWGALLIPAAALLPELRFNTDVSQFDVASPELLKLEKQADPLLIGSRVRQFGRKNFLDFIQAVIQHQKTEQVLFSFFGFGSKTMPQTNGAQRFLRLALADGDFRRTPCQTRILRFLGNIQHRLISINIETPLLRDIRTQNLIQQLIRKRHLWQLIACLFFRTRNLTGLRYIILQYIVLRYLNRWCSLPIRRQAIPIGGSSQ